MEFIFIIILVILVLIIVYLLHQIKNGKGMISIKENNDQIIENHQKSYFPIVQIIEDEKMVPNSNYLIKNDDIKKAIVSIDNVGLKTHTINNKIKNLKEIKDKNFFSTDSESASKMIMLKDKKYIGTQRNKGSNKFSGQTKFKNEELAIKNINKQQIVDVGFNALSMVVSQYYMSEINDKLKKISDDIKEISDFQNNKYDAEIVTIISKVKEIIENQNEILKDEEIRRNAYYDNKELEGKCVELLVQANLAIVEILKKKDLDYKTYQDETKNLNKWCNRQQLTSELLLKIGDLRYTLSNGKESSKYAHHQYNTFKMRTEEINNQLSEWHKYFINKFGIEIDNKRKKGTLYHVRKYTIGMINEKWNYQEIQNDTIKQIELQTNLPKLPDCNNEKQDEVIYIQKYRGEYYNIPKEMVMR